jgi:hypothetical protein
VVVAPWRSGGKRNGTASSIADMPLAQQIGSGDYSRRVAIPLSSDIQGVGCHGPSSENDSRMSMQRCSDLVDSLRLALSDMLMSRDRTLMRRWLP